MVSHLKTFDDRKLLAESLADAVAATLAAAIDARGQAVLAVSGGSTPKAFFQALSTRALDWEKVAITLVDERFVPADNPRSNHLLVAENLLKNAAAAAEFVPLYHQAETAEEAGRLATEETAELGSPFDVVILGMGNDGHTASFFPGGDNLERALDLGLPPEVIAMEAEGAGEPRLTFTLSALDDAELLVLHIEGAEKKAVLDKALGDGADAEMPIRAVLRHASSPVSIYWAP
ncbi:6-phosphogluconolactonase [Rhizobium sp. RU36D]|uniref:6-phosphogluconolactonase n=1 Tax=Rhizobium sp. RU36D TaxID=1907415 RepID=UPI0009D81321|nr:6-phosphogluconolactonase [Rhizobium sp. RU36D]SMC84654.1 6-phosphogluconolactonase [Rhizobium sp. RU36D]